jgi:hypothetical protein
MKTRCLARTHYCDFERAFNIENKIWEERVDQVITQDEDELIKDNTRINSSQHLFIRWCCIVGERHRTTHLKTT